MSETNTNKVTHVLFENFVKFMAIFVTIIFDVLFVIVMAYNVLPAISAYMATLAGITSDMSQVAWLATWFVPYLFVAGMLFALTLFITKFVYRKLMKVANNLCAKMENRKSADKKQGSNKKTK